MVKFQGKQDIAIINDDYPYAQQIGTMTAGQRWFFSRTHRVAEGCFIDQESIVVAGLATLPASLDSPQLIVHTSDIKLRGKHNWENISAASLAALAGGVPLETIQQAIKNFQGLEHRLELVAQKQGVSYYNDSFSTVPETTMAAVAAFSEPVILILGGSEKHSDFTQLAHLLSRAKQLKTIILIGETAPRIKQALGNAGYQGPLLEGATSMQALFAQIAEVRAPGDAVVLSPGCASFDLFANYKDRGEQFKQAVAALPE
jgi:UDP-N-acetylmuramoylalanine--D-glutamate ligase